MNMIELKIRLRQRGNNVEAQIDKTTRYFEEL